ncbi:MAG: RNA-guided endonuclease InsQ/TnpB family protein [Dissulfurispiraceae bacterium]
MVIRRGYMFRLRDDPVLMPILACHAGMPRFLWNKALETNLRRLESRQPLLWYRELAFWLTVWKRSDEMKFLAEANCQCLQQTLKQLDRAFKDVFDKGQPYKCMPTWKKRADGDSFSMPQHFRIEGNRVLLPKIGWLRFFKSRQCQGVPKNLTVSRHGDRWFISIQTELDIPEPVHNSTSEVGIDMGISKFATLSDGTSYQPLNRFQSLEERLAKGQRKLSRKVKFSANWNKQLKRVQRTHSLIADARKDYLHKISTAISKNHAMVAMEDLRVSCMSRSARGTVESPGSNVTAKSGLNKAILDQGWGMFRTMVQYKLVERGGTMVLVDLKHTSQRCSACLHVSAGSRRSQGVFQCVACGTSLDADVNAALNILAAGSCD